MIIRRVFRPLGGAPDSGIVLRPGSVILAISCKSVILQPSSLANLKRYAVELSRALSIGGSLVQLDAMID